MRVILSRKGFDAANGGGPSPILPDGRLLSLPIPDVRAPLDYASAYYDGRPLSSFLLQQHRCVRSHTPCHLDPDLRPGALPRQDGWRPLFGQAGQAQSHLRNEGVGVGDLFLFFGWFRQTQRQDGRLAFVPGAPDLHVLFGWLQVGEIVEQPADSPGRCPWATYHPHFHGEWGRHNTLYLAAPAVSFAGETLPLPGGGVFPRYQSQLQLTEPGRSRSVWQLPGWFHPNGRLSTLSYHSCRARWTIQHDQVRLKSAGRGQEFVLHTADYPEAIEWARQLLV